jgi:hypothetical protein
MMRWTHWWPTSKRSINCPGKDCPICEVRRAAKANKQPQVHGMSRRFAINVINRETNRAEIMEQGVGFFEELRDLRTDLLAEKKDLTDVDLKVRRRGTGQDDTSYRIDIDEEKQLSPSDKEMIKNKTNLEEYFKAHEPAQILRLLQGEKWEDVFASKAQDAQDDSSDGDEEVVLA